MDQISSGKTNYPGDIRCPRCGSRNFHYRRKTQDYVCRQCPVLFRVNREMGKVVSIDVLEE